jgi:hypothetical protein
MPNETNALFRIAQSVLLFPTHFQGAFIAFAWGAEDLFWLAMAKRVLLLLPVLGVLFGCWLTVGALLTVLLRTHRREFIMDLFTTWMDLAKSIGAFWGGLVKFVFEFVVVCFGVIKVAVFSLWSLVQEFVFMPFRLIMHVTKNVATSRIPWIAVVLTIFWCLIEAVIFTYVTTPLVVDTFSNITGDQLTETGIRIPLFVFLFFVVLGSYAVLSTFLDAVRKRNIHSIIGIGVIEIVVLFVEVVFLYREFVDALVPWFAQYSENFELGMFWTLAISSFAWFGIRSLSWFLFAAHGTPTIMAVIQGRGLQIAENETRRPLPYKPVASDFMAKIKQDLLWIGEAGERLIHALMLPPLQIVGAAINFGMLLLSGKHMFELPLKSMDDLKKERVSDEKQPKTQLVPARDQKFAQPAFGELQNVKTH